MNILLESEMKFLCSCGREGRYSHLKEGKEVMSCNKYRVCESNVCAKCDKPAQYRYAPYDGENNWDESARWRCEDHGPDGGWNGEWDYLGD